jgi:single-strand DNA-binding protein
MLPKINHLFRLAKEPDIRYSASGTAVCKLFLVASEKYKDKENTFWLSATAFGKTAELIANIEKGQRVFLSGRIQTDEWTDNQGQKRTQPSLIVESFEYIESKNASQGAPQRQQAQPASQEPTTDEFFEDSIPF